jgi:S-adenosylmethionine:tRNA ribosyltransferase-isomerase
MEQKEKRAGGKGRRCQQASAQTTAYVPAAPLWEFSLPEHLQASEPPEARGLARDEVRLLVSYRRERRVVHAHFRELPAFLRRGDLLVINTSGTMNAALRAVRGDGLELELHLSTHLPGDLWVVEVRRPAGTASQPFFEMQPGETLTLPAGGRATLHTPYGRARALPQPGAVRLWIATLALPTELPGYLATHGFPIRYSYLKGAWPIEYYRSVFVTEIGSAEMPSAGRPFTAALITRLVAEGVQIAPLLLHTGVSSLEADEPPYEEYYRVPAESAALVNAARQEGRRVIAVGTTVVRALETVTDAYGLVHAGEGWSDLVITPQRGMRAVDGLLTGLHEPRSSHLAMLEALVERSQLAQVYEEALRAGYRWHEFGDMHLILP